MTCELRAWTVFSTGTWTSLTWPTRSYDRAYLEKIVANFQRLRRRVVPAIILGHNHEQRLAQSLGFPRLGRIESLTVLDDGRLNAFGSGLPVEIGATINAGWLVGASIEIGVDETVGSELIDGPRLKFVTLHGEAEVSLAEVCRLPPAVFANGEPVPPATSMSRWLEKMIELGATNRPNPEPKAMQCDSPNS